MKHRQNYRIGILVFLISSLSILVNAQGAREIIELSQNAMKVKSFESISTLQILDGKGNERIRKNTMASKTFPDGTEKRIIKFTAPAEVKGTGILIFDHEQNADDMWVYLPALKKTRRIVSSEKSKAFMGSEFSNADMTAPAMEDFNYELMDSETINEEKCWVVSSSPKNMDLEDVYGFSSCQSYITKNDYIVLQSDYFDFDGEKYKTIKTLKYKLLDKNNRKFMILERLAINHSNGRSSRMIMDQIQLAQTKDEYFSVSYLER